MQKLIINNRTDSLKKDLPPFFSSKTTHSYHLVDVSLWPFLCGSVAFQIACSMVIYFHDYNQSSGYKAFIVICALSGIWWRDVIREAAFEERYTPSVKRSLRLGVQLFIVSEVMFFFGFFWAYLHGCLSPSYSIGSVWPPVSINPPPYSSIPFTNTIILLSSGATLTWSHHAAILRSKFQAIFALILTLALAVIFIYFQGLEYVSSPFHISDGIYGSCFFMATGFHGFHVLVGAIGLFVALIRLVRSHFANLHHIGFESVIWYWHFVDVVWVFLFFVIYYWTNNSYSVPVTEIIGQILKF